LGRIILVPIVVWAITSGEMRAAFFLASELGAVIDPLADKALIVSIYVALAIAGALPISLVILVVSRDIMIISGFMVSWVVGQPIPVRPHPVSKANTAAQIVLATLVLAEKAFVFDAALAVNILIGLVVLLTLLSMGLYLAEWLRHMNSYGAGH
jgi:cardiolipin synthase (CMP-forming)